MFAGVGIPLLAATLAQRNFAPHLTILFEGGTIGPFIVPGELPPSTNEQRCTRRANMVLPITDVLLLLQRGYVDVGFMGGAQIDRFGNLNSSFIGDADNPKIRLPGTGGGNDISSLTNMIVAMKHEKRRFVGKVDFITSPGWHRGPPHARASAACRRAACGASSPTSPFMGFDEDTREMKVLALHQGVTREQVQDNTGFELLFDRHVETRRAAARRTSSRCCATSTPSGSTRRDVISRVVRRNAAPGCGAPRRGAEVCRHPRLARGDGVRSTWPEEADRVRHRDAQLHQVSGDAERAGADRLRRAHGGAGLRVAVGVGSHPARRRAELPDPRGADDPHRGRGAHHQDQDRHRHPRAADAQPRASWPRSSPPSTTSPTAG